MSQVIPLHTEFLSDDEISRVEPRARTWGEWATEYGAALSVAGCLVFWLAVAVACILSDDAAWFVSRAFVAAFGFGCLAAIVLGAGRH